jgi:transposase
MMKKKSYPSDLTDAEWELLAPLIPPPKTGGNPRTTAMRGVCDAIHYQLKTGCQWGYLPGDFPPPPTVYIYYRKWMKKGIWQALNHTRRDRCREQVGKSKQPPVASPDSQSVETTEKRGDVSGFDGGKQVKGRKRQALVDSLGLVVKVVVAEANGSERVLAATAVMELLEENPDLLEKVALMWVDSGYGGDRFALGIWLMIQAKVEVIKRESKEFKVLPDIPHIFVYFYIFLHSPRCFDEKPSL